jgi:hypothetical protein
VATPPEVTLATVWLDVDQLTNGSSDSVVPSLNEPTALYWIDEPGAIKLLGGCSEIEVSVPESTVSGTDPVALAPLAVNVALMVAFPVLTPSALPKLPDELPTVATAVLFEPHVELGVRSAVEESSNTPVAVKCTWPPIGMVGVAGVIEIETILALVTVNGVEPTTEPRVAVIVAVPGATVEPPPVLAPMVNTELFEDVQVTCCVMLRVLPSLNLPMAVKNTFVPAATLLLAGEIEIDCKFAALTVSEVLALTDSNDAEMVVVPTFFAVASPLTVMKATEVAEELQEVTSVTS